MLRVSHTVVLFKYSSWEICFRMGANYSFHNALIPCHCLSISLQLLIPQLSELSLRRSESKVLVEFHWKSRLFFIFKCRLHFESWLSSRLGKFYWLPLWEGRAMNNTTLAGYVTRIIKYSSATHWTFTISFTPDDNIKCKISFLLSSWCVQDMWAQGFVGSMFTWHTRFRWDLYHQVSFSSIINWILRIMGENSLGVELWVSFYEKW